MRYLLIILLLFNLYFYFDLVLPPKIKIIEPKDREVLRVNKIIFKGYADKRGELFINEIPVYFDDQGYFKKEFFLKEGVNKFIIKEKKFWDQERKIEKEVYYLP